MTDKFYSYELVCFMRYIVASFKIEKKSNPQSMKICAATANFVFVRDPA